MLDYEVIATGSTGNAVRIEDVLVDIGIPFKRLKEHLYDINYILITHKHGDHFKPATYKQIRKLFPDIKILGNYEIAQMVELDYIVNAGYPVEVEKYTFEAFEGKHDVLVYGWTWTAAGQQIMYLTDSCDVSNLPDRKYDYFFLEANHDENKINAIRGKDLQMFGYNAVDGALRHLSIQKAKGVYYGYRKSPDSPWIELHQSSRFY